MNLAKGTMCTYHNSKKGMISAAAIMKKENPWCMLRVIGYVLLYMTEARRVQADSTTPTLENRIPREEDFFLKTLRWCL